MDAIDTYLAGLPTNEQAALRRITDRVRTLVPKTEVKVYYGVPSFLVNGKLLVGIAAGKKFMSLYPTGEGVSAVADAYSSYDMSKGTIRFTVDKPISEPLIDLLIQTRLAQIQAQA